MRLSENTTSSALMGEPLWNTTPSRSVNSIICGLTISHDVASAGRKDGSSEVGSWAIRVSKVL